MTEENYDLIEGLRNEVARLKRELAREVSHRRTQAVAYLNLSIGYTDAIEELNEAKEELAQLRVAASMDVAQWMEEERELRERFEVADMEAERDRVEDERYLADETNAEFLYNYIDAYIDGGVDWDWRDHS